MNKTVAIIGDGGVTLGDKAYDLAYAIGREVAQAGYRVVTGGLTGVMEAALKGAKSATRKNRSETIAILPTFDKNDASPYAEIVIPTGLDLYRNPIVVNADAVVAVGGGSGTLSEMAHAWALNRLIIGMTGLEGWSGTLAGKPVDKRKRYEFEDVVFAAASAEEAVQLLDAKIDLYDRPRRPLRDRH